MDGEDKKVVAAPAGEKAPEKKEPVLKVVHTEKEPATTGNPILDALGTTYGRETITVEVPFKIKNQAEPIVLVLHSPDYKDLVRMTNIAYEIEYGIAVEKGLDKVPLTDARFEDYLSKIKNEKTREASRKNRPNSVIELHARTMSLVTGVPVILPAYLRTKDGKKAFENPKHLKAIVDMVESDSSLQSILIDAYTELTTKVEERKKDIKNE